MTKPLTIGLVSLGGQNWIGGTELTRNLILATSSYCQSEGIDVRFRIIGKTNLVKAHTAGLDNVANLEMIESKTSRSIRPAFVYLALRYLELRSIINKHEIDFVYPFDRSIPGTRCRTAAWIPDFQHKHLPEFFSEAEVAARDKSFQSIASRARKVVLSSKTAKQDFEGYFPEHSAKARVLSFRVCIPGPCLSSDVTKTRSKYNLPSHYFIVCNQFWQHKNHRVVLDAISLLAKENPGLVVAMTGDLHDYRKPNYTSELLAKIHMNGIHTNCRFLGVIPKQDQIELVRGAVAVIQPSFFEGWSTIVEEAHALNKPILLSDLPVHREQQPPEASFFDPHHAEHLAKLMRERMSLSPSTNPSSKYAEKIAQFGKEFLNIAMER
jgi:glycosyltransferase involved in cell wall biosynthesis